MSLRTDTTIYLIRRHAPSRPRLCRRAGIFRERLVRVRSCRPPPFINFSADSLLVFLHVHILSATHNTYFRYLHLLTLLGGSTRRLLQVRDFCRRRLFLVPIPPLPTCVQHGPSATGGSNVCLCG